MHQHAGCCPNLASNSKVASEDHQRPTTLVVDITSRLLPAADGCGSSQRLAISATSDARWQSLHHSRYQPGQPAPLCKTVLPGPQRCACASSCRHPRRGTITNASPITDTLASGCTSQGSCTTMLVHWHSTPCQHAPHICRAQQSTWPVEPLQADVAAALAKHKQAPGPSDAGPLNIMRQVADNTMPWTSHALWWQLSV